MLRRIDCVMIKVSDLEAALRFYVEVFGLRPLWRDERSIGLTFPEERAEIVLHCIDEIPSKIDVNYKVDDVPEAVARLVEHGCQLVAGPFPIVIGRCAVIRDPFDSHLTLVDTSKGLRTPNLLGGAHVPASPDLGVGS